MKKKDRKYSNFWMPIMWTTTVLALLVLLVAAKDKQQSRICRSLEVEVDHNSGLFFVDQNRIKDILWRNDISLIGQTLGELKFWYIEAILKNDPYIENAEIYVNAFGEMKIEVKQRKPILRVINRKGVSYYIDEIGKNMPFSSKFTARVPVATGSIDSYGFEGKVRDDLLKLAEFLQANTFWGAWIEQIVVDHKGEFELVPNIANHTILLGGINDIEQKFNNLLIFYQQGLKNVGWYKYKMINLKYKDQIVCTKY